VASGLYDPPVPLWLLPIIVLGALVLLVGIFALLSRIQGGRYLRPIVALVAKIPFMRRLMMKASAKAIERDNPELASAMRKVEQFGTPKTPQQAQKLLGRLTPAERRAYMAAVGEQGAMPEPANREQRRAMEKMQAGGPPASGKKSAGGKTGAKGKSTAGGKSSAGGKSAGRKKR
jgi:hypothetical protein